MAEKRDEGITILLKQSQEQRKLRLRLLSDELGKKHPISLSNKAVRYLLKESDYGSMGLKLKLKQEFRELNQEKLEDIIIGINAILGKNRAGKLYYDYSKEKYMYEP